MKIKLLIVSMGLTLSLNALAFYNDPIKKDNEVKDSTSLELSVPEDVIEIDQSALAKEIEKNNIKKEASSQIESTEFNQRSLAIQIEKNTKAKAEKEWEESRKDKKESLSQARVDFNNMVAEDNRRRKEADYRDRNSREALKNMRNEAGYMIKRMDFTNDIDLQEYKDHYDEMISISGGDRSSSYIESVGLEGAKKLYTEAFYHLNEYGERLFKDHQEASKWGYILFTKISKGEYVEIMEHWSDRIEKARKMIEAAKEYAYVYKKIDGFAEFEVYLGWREIELSERQLYAEELKNSAEYNPGENLYSNDVVMNTKEVEVSKYGQDYIYNIQQEMFYKIKNLNLIDDTDLLEFQDYYNRILETANGNSQSENVKVIGIEGAKKLYSEAWYHIHEYGEYLFKDKDEANSWDYSSSTKITKGRYVEMMKDWSDRIEKAQEMIDTAKEYAYVYVDIDGFAHFELYLDWRKSELQERQAYAKKLTESPRYNPKDNLY